MPNNTLRNPTKWYAPLGNGYVNVNSNNIYLNPFGVYTPQQITTQLGVNLLTQSGEELLINPNTFSFKNHDAWVSTNKSNTGWIPHSGLGHVYSGSTNQITDNLGDFLVTNNSNNIVTTPITVTGKNPTGWNSTGV